MTLTRSRGELGVDLTPPWTGEEESDKSIVIAAVERPRGLGRWSLMREVQSSIPRRGYIPHVTAEMQWHGVTPPGCDHWQDDK